MATCGWGAQNLVQLIASHLKKPKRPYFHLRLIAAIDDPLFSRCVANVHHE